MASIYDIRILSENLAVVDTTNCEKNVSTQYMLRVQRIGMSMYWTYWQRSI